MLKKALEWLRDAEPATFAGMKTAVLGLGASGVVWLTPLATEVAYWLGIAAIVLPAAQSVLTRFKVFAPKTVRDMTEGL